MLLLTAVRLRLPCWSSVRSLYSSAWFGRTVGVRAIRVPRSGHRLPLSEAQIELPHGPSAPKRQLVPLIRRRGDRSRRRRGWGSCNRIRQTKLRQWAAGWLRSSSLLSCSWNPRRPRCRYLLEASPTPQYHEITVDAGW